MRYSCLWAAILMRERAPANSGNAPGHLNIARKTGAARENQEVLIYNAENFAKLWVVLVDDSR
jgi:hypothetical protein